MSEAQERADVVQASMTTFHIVEALKHLDGAGVTELAKHLDLPKSTVHNHLRTLEECEFVVGEDGIYRVGLRFLDFGEFVRDRIELLQAGEEEVSRLAETTGELANLMVEEHGRGVYVYQAHGDRAVNTNLHVGKRVSLHQTAQGKAILAYSPPEFVEEVVERHGLPGRTQNSITDRETLYEELERIHERGYAVDDEEWLRGLRCVAAPIRNDDDHTIGAVSVAGPVSRMQDDRYESEIPERVTRSANVIELNTVHPE